MIVRSIVVFLLCVYFATAQERRWYVAGKFDSISTSNGTFSAKNIATTKDGLNWQAMGVGADDQINTVFVDTCKNVYIGGEFNNAGGVSVAQVAVWSAFSNNWAALGPPLKPVTTKPNVVNSITADCDGGCSSCKVYIGGKFEYILPNGPEAIGVVMFDNATKEWNNLGGRGEHKLSYSDNVNVVAKSVHGVTAAVDHLWIGGDFEDKIKYYSTSGKKWYEVANGPDGTDHVVNSITFVDPATVYIAGKFDAIDEKTGAKTCSNLCKYSASKFVQVSSAQFGPVTSIAHSGLALFVGGNIYNTTDSLSFDMGFGRVVDGTNEVPIRLYTATVNTTEPIVSSFACNANDNACTQGYVGVASAKGGFIRFYNHTSKAWAGQNATAQLSSGTPVLTTITSGYFSAGTPTTAPHGHSTAKRVVGIVFIVIVLILLAIVFASIFYEKYQKRKKVLKDLNEKQMRDAEL